MHAVALGATACMIGRPHLYALAAGGEAGVDHMLDFFQAGIERTLSLIGVNSMKELNQDMVRSAV